MIKLLDSLKKISLQRKRAKKILGESGFFSSRLITEGKEQFEYLLKKGLSIPVRVL